MTGKIKQQNLFLIENKPQLNQISTLGGLQFALMISVLMGYSPWRNAACEGASTSRGIHLWKKTLVKSRNSPLKLCGELFRDYFVLQIQSQKSEIFFLYFKIQLYFSETLYTIAGPDIPYSGELSVDNQNWLCTRLCFPVLKEKCYCANLSCE